MDPATMLLCLLGCFVASILALAIIVVRIQVAIHKGFRLDVSREIIPFNPWDANFSMEVTDCFGNATQSLSTIGFELVGAVEWPNRKPNVREVVLLFANRATRDISIVSMKWDAMRGGEAFDVEFIEFTSRFRDGTLVQTSNRDSDPSYSRPAGVFTTSLPLIEEMGLLFLVHRYLAEKHGGGAGRILRIDEEFHGDVRACMVCGRREEIERQIAKGYFYWSEAEDVLRATWKGAMKLSWGLIFPFKQIGRCRRNVKARRLLAKLRRSDLESVVNSKQ